MKITNPAQAVHLSASGIKFRYQGRKVEAVHEYSVSPSRIDGREDLDDNIAVQLEGEICLTPCRVEELTTC